LLFRNEVIVKMLLKLPSVTTTLSTIGQHDQSDKSSQCADGAGGSSDDCIPLSVVVILFGLRMKWFGRYLRGIICQLTFGDCYCSDSYVRPFGISPQVNRLQSMVTFDQSDSPHNLLWSVVSIVWAVKINIKLIHVVDDDLKKIPVCFLAAT